MQVYKFGGASVKDAAAVKNVAAILGMDPDKEKVVVLSAMGKTTNELEQIVNLYVAGNSSWQETLKALQERHLRIIKELFGEESGAMEQVLAGIAEGIRAFLMQDRSGQYHFIYDQVVSAGEYISTAILSSYCNSLEITNTLLDAKECIFTDNAYTEGKIDWQKTEKAICTKLPPLLGAGFVITQGFIGCSPEGFTTTLGREGSDYTAAVFSFCLPASRMTVWKDVPGIMNADPKEFADAQLLPEITYLEAIEMTYYGATVIHPKTIKPLQNKNIPLEVRSFVEHSKRGSIVAATADMSFLPPVIIMKRGQVLLSFSSKDFSFIAEDHLSKVFAVFAAQRLHINMMQNAAVSFSICVDNKKEKIEPVKEKLQEEFRILTNENLSLLTIRHYNNGIIERLTNGKDILLRQASRQTIQVLMREN